MAAKPAGFAAGEAAVSKLGNDSNLDLPFAMFSHQYESKAIKLYYCTFTISYTPWFPYQINMTLIECSRIRTDRPFAWRSDSWAAMTARSLQHPGLRSVVVRLCPNVYHTSVGRGGLVSTFSALNSVSFG